MTFGQAGKDGAWWGGGRRREAGCGQHREPVRDVGFEWLGWMGAGWVGGACEANEVSLGTLAVVSRHMGLRSRLLGKGVP